MKKYFGDFEGIDDVIGWAPKDLKDEEVIIARYDTPDYEGYAWCLYRRDGKLFEVSDSHCSCFGLECWEPEETTIAALLMRPEIMENSDYMDILSKLA